MIQQPRLESNVDSFQISIRQQPEHARMCGLKPKVNRRKIDPPLILQVEPINGKEIHETINCSQRYICHLTLLSSNNQHCDYFLDKDGSVMNNIVGESVVGSVTLYDPVNSKQGLFFVYHDISIRLTGTYRFSCRVVDFLSGVVKQVDTRSFEVYNSKEFPGNNSLSLLSESFFEQGIRIKKKSGKE
ncbi:velvet factor [Globomyces pollinis-pini]|nr:velvet factor [Globomyces pollinis-pini]